MFRAGHRGPKPTVVAWKGDLVIRGCLTGLKLRSVGRLGVLSVIVGMLVGVVVGHDVRWPGLESWGYFIL